MKKVIWLSLFVLAAIVISCDKESEFEGGECSHNTGKNCMSCHKDFKLAGSVYDKSLNSAYAGAKIKVNTQANGAGSALLSLTSDKTGNYYMGSSVNFGSGIYVGVEGTSGTVKYMNSPINSGACNSCHGSSTSKVWAE